MCQGSIWDWITSSYKHSLLVTQWGLHVGAIWFHGIGHNYASIGFETSLSCYVSMYYLITMDLKLQRSFNNHMYCFVAPMCQHSIWDLFTSNYKKNIVDCILGIISHCYLSWLYYSKQHIYRLGLFLSCHMSTLKRKLSFAITFCNKLLVANDIGE